MDSPLPVTDSSILSMTADALNNSQPGLDEFNTIFESCSTLFDQGEDAKGMNKLQEALPHLGEFANSVRLLWIFVKTI